jgi:3-hydroxyacyl-CoA dehydrogenase
VEAIRMVERGDATAEDVDTAMELGAGYRTSPFS